MERRLAKFLRDLFTCRDNVTWDLGRIMWCLGTLVYFSMTLYSLYQGIPVDPLNWATGFGAILAGGGAAIALKKNDEPGHNTVTTTIQEDPTVIKTTTQEGEAN